MSPYITGEPSLISLSGGRTSGYMLHKILEAHRGTLPAQTHVVFFNTGKEREETYSFVREMSRRWSVEIKWLQYERQRDAEGWRNGFRIVDFATASRHGEPFDQLIAARSYLPNQAMRFCTQELKVKTGKRFMRSIGHERWTNVIGIRADEDRNPKPDPRWWENKFPLREAGVDVADVMHFWNEQPFDLELEPGEGNCDLCFLKGRRNLVQLIIRRPQDAEWWKRHEQTPGRIGTFSSRYSVADLIEQSRGGPMFSACEWEEREIVDCNCTD